MKRNYEESRELLTESGFCLIESDEEMVDFLASKPIRVQLRTRLGVYARNVGKDLHMCFPVREVGCPTRWFMVPHDTLMKVVDENTDWRKYNCLEETQSWKVHGEYNIEKPSKALLNAISDFELT